MFAGSDFAIFAKNVEKGAVIASAWTKCGSRSVADRMNSWAQDEGAPGMGYIIYGEDGEARGPIAKALGADKTQKIKQSWSVRWRCRFLCLCKRIRSSITRR